MIVYVIIPNTAIDFKKSLKTAHCGTVQRSFQSHHKSQTLGFCSLWFFCHCFVDGKLGIKTMVNKIHIVDFLMIHI